jgi:HEAT repeat protein
MAALLRSPDATPAGKAFVCRQLATIATEKQAAAVAALLADQETADAALGTLEQIRGAAVDQILHDALRTTEGRLRIGVVNALGQRRDRAAVEYLIPLLAAGDGPLATAAASALGKIGGDAAVAALKKSLVNARDRWRTEIADACLNCADQLLAAGQSGPAAALYAQLSGPSETEQVRMAALRGIVRANPEQAVGALCQALTSGDPALESMALQLVPQVPGATTTEQLGQCLSKVSAPVQKLLLNALAVRGDVAVRGAVEATLASTDPAVRIAALNALGTLGDAATVKTFVDRIKAVAGTPEGDAARNGLVRLRGPGVNQVLIGLLSQGDSGGKVELIRILAARNARDAISALETAAEAPDAAVRREAWKALAGLVRAADVPALLELLVRVPEGERADAEKTVAAVLRIPDQPDVRPLLQTLETPQTPAVRCSLVRIASAVGDDALLPALCKEVQSADASVRDAAIRGLAAWPTPAPFEDLVKLARTAPEPVHRVLALRAALRLASKVQGRTPKQMTGLVTELMQLAHEPAERKAVLAELGRCPTGEALQAAQSFLADPELATEAGVAVTQIASAIRDTHRDQALAALLPLLAGNRDATVTGRAGKVLKDILRPANLALGATATSPDGLEPDGASGGDQAAIDGDPNTYWDEVDNADEYRLRITFSEPKDVSSINILWHPYEQHQAQNLDVLCDGTVVAQVRKAKCFDHEMFVAFASVRCTWVELVIPGKNGLVSPAIHEFQIFGSFPPRAGGDAASSGTR